MHTDMKVVLAGKARIQATLPPPRYAFDSFDHGINRLVVVQEPYQAVFYVGPFDTRPGDTLSFFFGDDLIPLVQVPLPEGPIGEMPIQVPAAQILRYVADNQTGRFDIWYAIVRPLESLESVRLTNYLIDFEPPGGIPVFGDPPYINTNLAPIPELEAPIAPGQPLVMHVPPWQNMTLGDKLFVRWGSRALGPFEITSQTQVGQPVQVTVSWEIISGTDGGVARVDYYITDTVNNHSYYSAPKVVDAGVPLLPRPLLPDHLAGVIDLDTLGGNDVRVHVTYNMVPTDSITLIVDRVTENGTPLPVYSEVKAGSAVGTVEFYLPNLIVKAIPRGSMTLRYEVSRVPMLRSEVTTARVQGTGFSLAQAETPEFPTYQIDLERLDPAGLRVDIPRYGFLDDTDRITITSVFTAQGISYTDVQTHFGSEFAGGSVLSIRVPAEKVRPAANGTGTITYTVQPVGQVSVTSPTRNLTIVGTAPGEWDLEYDFDLDRLRFVERWGTIFFPEGPGDVMSMYFDPDATIPLTTRMGVEQFPFAPGGDFAGNCHFIGYPPNATNATVTFINFHENWDVVRFSMTSLDGPVSVSFKDANLNIIGGILNFPGGDPTRQHRVQYDDTGRGRIRHVELRANDVIRLDSFKFRRAARGARREASLRPNVSSGPRDRRR